MANYSITDTNFGYRHKFHKRIALAIAALTLILMMLLSVHVTASADTPPTRFDFTQAELTNNWGPERIAPSGSFTSVSAFGRDHVAQISIVSSKASTNASLDNPYYWTEGIKTKPSSADNFDAPGDFGTSVSVDLYLDKAWDNNAVRAGLWTVGNNGSTGTDAANYNFGILEFAHVSGYEGFRYYGPTGWVPVKGFHGYGKWTTLNITLDTENDLYKLSVDGTVVGNTSAPAPSNYLYSVMLNQRNFGKDPQAGLNNVDYSAYWQGGVVSPTGPKSKDECTKDGWMKFTGMFKNQGQCVSSTVKNSNSN
ncbi:MAG: hypothetical protein QFB87_01150 [Patescibacteria group bacterium]|nr:hypothetical protein [Patescibacteria group bacterium]